MMLKNNVYVKSYLNIIKESVDVEKYQRIAKGIGGEYIPETNTIDCKGNFIRFDNWWLNEQGSFDFKLINTSDDWSFMFQYTKIKYLPEDFIIPDHVKCVQQMFAMCLRLTKVPYNFTIPNGVTNCRLMFFRCESLTELPPNFHIPTHADCTNIFHDCDKLENTDPEHYILMEI